MTLADLYSEHASNAQVRAVYPAHREAIEALQRAALALQAVGEDRFAAAYESRAMDLELLAKRHMTEIANRQPAEQVMP